MNEGAVVAPAGTLLLTETWDWFTPGKYVGSALALSYFDYNGSDPSTVAPGGYNGALQTLNANHNAGYAKTQRYEAADPKGINNVAFCDGHTKGITNSRLQQSGQYWSIGNNNAWP